MIKGALALALMSTVGMGGMVTVSSDGDVTTSYFMPSVVVMNHGHKQHYHHRAPKPVIHHTVLHHPSKPMMKKDHKHQPPKAQKPNKPKQQGNKNKAPAKKGKSKGGKR